MVAVLDHGMMKARTTRPLGGFLALGFALLLGACSTAPKKVGEPIEPPIFPADRVFGEGVAYQSDSISDPLEGLNRRIYRFNHHFDRYIFLPGVSAYQFITPDPLERGLHNFFNNLTDVTTLINSILQTNLDKTANTTARLMLNTTVGLLGFFDVAHEVPKSVEDFGQTLGVWGVGNGPYLVLPILGPSNLRDGSGYVVDLVVRNELIRRGTDLETYQELILKTLWALDIRANVAFRYYETGSPMEYEMVRTLYTTKRQLDIER